MVLCGAKGVVEAEEDLREIRFIAVLAGGIILPPIILLMCENYTLTSEVQRRRIWVYMAHPS